jgi:hypothetical protein
MVRYKTGYGTWNKPKKGGGEEMKTDLLGALLSLVDILIIL